MGELFKDKSYTNLPHIVTYILFGAILLYIIYEVIIFKFFPRKYHGLKFTTKNITTIALMAGLSATVVIVISMTIPITVLPPVRIGFEGIMVKMSGMFFGPIAGIIVGAVTELLTMLFVPSYVHPAYFVLAVGFGFVSGLASYSRRISKGHKKWWIMAFINIFVIAWAVFMYFATTSMNADDVKWMGITIKSAVYTWVLIGVDALVLAIIWAITIVLEKMKKKELLSIVLPIILMVVLTELLLTITLSPWGNKGFLGIPENTDAKGYLSLLMVDSLKSPIHMIFNTVILSTVFWVLRPMIESKKIGTFAVVNDENKPSKILKVRR